MHNSGAAFLRANVEDHISSPASSKRHIRVATVVVDGVFIRFDLVGEVDLNSRWFFEIPHIEPATIELRLDVTFAAGIVDR